ncbi:response regulator transcription factor [Streptomyces sp. NPDC048349]|uniref:response regulator transcription factor n=1 Tax=Streptomyces sp. NPDC048349 TaxID=3155486 RepID=UPI00344AC11C
MSISVVIADDQELVRTGFRMILDNSPGIEVLADVADGHEALAAVRELRPNVLLADIQMPGLDGLEVTRLLRQDGASGAEDGRRPQVVIITTFDDDAYVRTALRYGASGFLLKDASPALLVEAVRAAAAGDSLISPAVTVRLLADMAAGRSPVSGGRPPREELTEREKEVVVLTAQGRTNAEIADELHLSVSSIKAHLARVQAKLDARNRVEVALWAWESGLSQGRS